MQLVHEFRKNLKVLLSICIFMLIVYISSTDFIDSHYVSYITDIHNNFMKHNINNSYKQMHTILGNSSILADDIKIKENVKNIFDKKDLEAKENTNNSESERLQLSGSGKDPLQSEAASELMWPTVTTLQSISYLPSGASRDPPPVATGPSSTSSAAASTSKLVVFYTPFYSIGWESFLGNGTDLTAHHCPQSNCRFSLDKSKANTADAVVFHADDFSIRDVPALRDEKQFYIWFTMEAPGIHGFKGRKYFHQLLEDGSLGSKSFFNWTFTYHQLSDLHMPYGYLTPKIESEFSTKFLSGLDEDATMKSYLVAMQEAKITPSVTLKYILGDNWQNFLDRPKLAAWMVSHCLTDSGRELYVSELQKYVKVDVYGACGPLDCGRSHKDTYCYTEVLKPNYMFYFAFENNCCTDYITEKLWAPMRHGLVPIVYGCGNYSKFLPPGSYIDATYIKPKQLAALLTKISSDKESYGMYHIWRKFWTVSDRPPLCELCEKLHHSEAAMPVQKTDLAHWWEDANQCTTYYPERRHPGFNYMKAKASHLMESVGSLFG